MAKGKHQERAFCDGQGRRAVRRGILMLLVLCAIGDLRFDISEAQEFPTDENVYVPVSRTVTGTNGITGGGDLSTNRTFTIDPVVVATNGRPISTFVNDAGYITSAGITNTAGTFLITFSDAAGTETNTTTSTNTLFSYYVATNTFTTVRVSSLVQVRNTEGSTRDYFTRIVQQPTGGATSNLVTIAAALQSGGGSGNYIFTPLDAFTTSLTNGGTITIQAWLAVSSSALGANILNFRAYGGR